MGTSVIALHVSSQGLAFLPTPPSTFQTPSPFRSSSCPGSQDGSACPLQVLSAIPHLLLTQAVHCLPLSRLLLTLLFLVVFPAHLRIKNCVSHLFVAQHVGVKQALKSPLP